MLKYLDSTLLSVRGLLEMTSGNQPQMVVSAELGVECTLPVSDLRHYITDEELDRIGEMKADHIGQLFWASVGALVGSVIPATDAISRFQDRTNPMDVTGLATAILAFMSLAIMAVSGWLLYERSKGRTDLLTIIRSRPRAKVSPR